MKIATFGTLFGTAATGVARDGGARRDVEEVGDEPGATRARAGDDGGALALVALVLSTTTERPAASDSSISRRWRPARSAAGQRSLLTWTCVPAKRVR